VHFFGADAFSFGEGVTLQDGIDDVEFACFGRALRNPIRIEPRGETLISVNRSERVTPHRRRWYVVAALVSWR